jgi:hypothetical protein
MPIVVIRIDVFISSPSDLAEERSIIRRVIEKLNRSSLRDTYFLVPLLYEDEVPPEIGKEAQLIVDRYMQVKNSYIMVSLFWTRMGTPFTIIETNEKYESGTQYEILKGYENFQEKGQPHILLYKKEKENPRADPTQKEKVEKFFNNFIGNSPKLNGLFAKYTDSIEFEEKIESDLTKLIQSYPPNTENIKWIEQPEFKEEPRRIDAAMPRQTAVGETTPVQVMVCLPNSEGLKAFLPKKGVAPHEIKKRDVRAGGVTVAFPLDKKTGGFKPISAIIEITANDFKIKDNPQKVQLTRGLDSGQITFDLIPLHSRNKYSMVIVRLKCKALEVNEIEHNALLGNSEIECGSVVLYTVIQKTKKHMAPQTIWDLVSHPLTVVSLPHEVINFNPREIEKRKTSLILSSYPTVAKVEAGHNGPVFLEDHELDSIIRYDNITIEGITYGIYSLDNTKLIHLSRGRNYAWAKVEGRSMNNSYPIPIDDGDYILFCISSSAHEGDFVAASVPDGTTLGYKPVVKQLVNNELISHSTSIQEFPPIPINKETRIVGVVIAVAKPET